MQASRKTSLGVNGKKTAPAQSSLAFQFDLEQMDREMIAVLVSASQAAKQASLRANSAAGQKAWRLFDALQRRALNRIQPGSAQ